MNCSHSVASGMIDLIGKGPKIVVKRIRGGTVIDVFLLWASTGWKGHDDPEAPEGR